MTKSQVFIFDFDGTLSLIREGWSRVMAELGQEHVPNSDPQWVDHLEWEMLLLSGRPSIVQMQKLREEILAVGFTSSTPEKLHDLFLSRLNQKISQRKESLKSLAVASHSWTVPGTHELLDHLAQQGYQLFLVSGTDKNDVIEEAKLLDLEKFFGNRVYAPNDLSGKFHKKDAIHSILTLTNSRPEDVISFGDGYSETVEIKKINGLAIGVASSEVGKPSPNVMKEKMLRELKADFIIPDFRNLQSILAIIDLSCKK